MDFFCILIGRLWRRAFSQVVLNVLGFPGEHLTLLIHKSQWLLMALRQLRLWHHHSKTLYVRSKTTVTTSAVTPPIFQDKLFHVTKVLKQCRSLQKRLCVKELNVSTVVQNGNGKWIARTKNLSYEETGWDGRSLLHSCQLNETNMSVFAWHLCFKFLLEKQNALPLQLHRANKHL